MKSFKQTTLRTATIAAMFVTLGAVAVSAQDPGAPPPVSQGADGGSWQGGPAPRFGAPGDDGPGNGGPGSQFGGPQGGPGGRFGGPQGGFGGPGGKPSVVQIPAKALAVLLGLTSDQTDKIATIQKDARPLRSAAFRPGGRGQDGPPDPQDGRGFPDPQERGGFAGPQGRRGAGGEAQKKAKADIMAVLTSSQKARLPEVTDEVCALRAARVPLEALPSLGLSGDQQKKIASVGAEGSKKIAALISGDANDEDDAPGAAMQDVHEAMGDDVSALLTSDQRAKVRSARREFRPEGGRGGMMMTPPGGRMSRNAGEDGMPPPPRDGEDFAQGPGGRGRMGHRGPGGQPGPDMQGGPGMGDGAPAGPPPPDGPPADGGGF